MGMGRFRVCSSGGWCGPVLSVVVGRRLPLLLSAPRGKGKSRQIQSCASDEFPKLEGRGDMGGGGRIRNLPPSCRSPATVWQAASAYVPESVEVRRRGQLERGENPLTSVLGSCAPRWNCGSTTPTAADKAVTTAELGVQTFRSCRRSCLGSVRAFVLPLRRVRGCRESTDGSEVLSGRERKRKSREGTRGREPQATPQRSLGRIVRERRNHRSL